MAKKMQLGATPGKLALVAILAVILIAVVVFQLGNGAASSTPPVSPVPALARPRQAEAAASVVDPNARTRPHALKPIALEVKPLPKFKVHEVSSYDPFARPNLLPVSNDKLPSPAEEDRQRIQQAEREQAIAEIGKFAVDAIFRSGTDQVAVVGGREIRVGDIFRGFRVTAIEADGVKLEELQTDGR